MAHIQNTTAGNRDISALVGPADEKGKKTPVMFTVPKRTGSEGAYVNGSAEIDDAFLSEAKKDVVVKAWFESGDLVEGKAHKAAHEEPTHGKSHR